MPLAKHVLMCCVLKNVVWLDDSFFNVHKKPLSKISFICFSLICLSEYFIYIYIYIYIYNAQRNRTLNTPVVFHARENLH
jgi:hypothetical protein